MQELMDERVVRLLGGDIQPVELAKRLARYLDESQTPDRQAPVVPNDLTISVNSRDLTELHNLDPALEAKLADYAIEYARERGFNFQGPPVVRLSGVDDVARGQTSVSGRVSAREVGGPASPPVSQAESAGAVALAYLVTVGGTEPIRFAINHVPFRIGRGEGNDLALPDDRVSRNHAAIDISQQRLRCARREQPQRDGTERPAYFRRGSRCATAGWGPHQLLRQRGDFPGEQRAALSLDVLLLVLRLSFLVLLYVFLIAVVRVAWRGLRATATIREAMVSPSSRVRLRVLRSASSNTVGSTFDLWSSATLGRAPDNSIVLPDVAVSAHHAAIRNEGGQWWLEDLRSTNGTAVNDQWISEPAILYPGDSIRLGDVMLTLEVDQPAVVQEAQG